MMVVLLSTNLYLTKKGSRSGTTYSPNVKFINEQIRYWSGRGYYFIGFVHSHPQGFTAISTGRGGGYGYTVSDEDAIVKLLGGMKGTRRLYFPVVQSSVYGKFSMRVFCGEKDLSGSVKIWEDRNIHIVEDVSGNCVRRELRAYLPMDRYSHSTAIIVGAGGGADLAEWLTRAGVNKFILLDSTRYEYSDLSGGAFFRDIGGYKADAVARRIHDINPASRVKIIRQHIDNDIKTDDFRFWLDNVDRRKSLVIFCEGGKDDFNILKELCSACGIALIRSYAYPGYQPAAQYVHTEFYDFWANSCANAKCEVDHIGGLYGVNPLNTALFGKVNAFFSCPTGKKERKDIAWSEEVKPLSVEKYEPLYSKTEIERKKVVIVGCGGSRSYAENLARSGIKHFVLIDADAYGRSNLQTQMAYADELGSHKAEVIADRIRLIAPDADVTVVKSMLDENMTDERFAAYIGEEWLADPYSVLLAACTDNVIAQVRCSRLALKYGFPFLMAGIYPGGRVLEMAFFHPAISTVCPRCMFNSGSRQIFPSGIDPRQQFQTARASLSQNNSMRIRALFLFPFCYIIRKQLTSGSLSSWMTINGVPPNGKESSIVISCFSPWIRVWKSIRAERLMHSSTDGEGCAAPTSRSEGHSSARKSL